MKTLKLTHTIDSETIPTGLKFFDLEILELILVRQKEQDNPRNLLVFLNNPRAGKSHNGFDWNKTPEGHEFWEQILLRQNFSLFHDTYKVVWVRRPEKDVQVINNLKVTYKIK